MTEIRADSPAGPAPAVATPETIPSHHLTDEQDRIMTGQLNPGDDAKSRANALYAEAMLGSPENHPEEALSRLRQVATLDPHFADAQVKIATLLLQLGQLEPALDQLRTAITANPGSVEIKAMLGYVQELNGQNNEALRLSKDALTKDPTQSRAMRVMLEIAGDQGDLAGGVLHIEDILKTGGASVPASSWLTLARLYVEVARNVTPPPGDQVILQTRLPIYLQAAAKPPPDVETLTLLADTYHDLGRKHDALKTLRQAAAIEPSNVDIILRCADLETELGEQAEALKNYEEAYALNPGVAGLREMLIRLYLANERFEDAAQLLQEALADSPQDSNLGIDLGIAYAGAHRQKEARDCFDRVFAADSCPPEAYLKLAGFQLTGNQIDQAAATLAAAAKRFPQSARVRFYQAIEYRYEKNYAAALDCLDQVRALATGPEAAVLDSDYYLESAMTLNLAGRKDLLEKTLHEGLAKYPENPDLMNELAYFWADQDTHLNEALALSGRALELDSDNGAIVDTRGWTYFQLGLAKDALPYLQRAALLTNNDPVVLQHLGDAYLKLGRRSEALEAWRRGLEKDPHNGDLAKRINTAPAQATNANSRSAPTP
jgi:tetratricopeptide (TPR) repeat protein